MHPDSLVDFAQKKIQEAIQDGTYTPGSRLSAQDIANSLGISRTPVIAAINRLVAEGIAETPSRRGTYVSRPSPRKIRETIEIRRMVECFAIPYAIINADFCPEAKQEMEDALAQLDALVNDADSKKASYLEAQFHRAFVVMTGNKQLIKLYDNNWSIGVVFHLFSISKMALYRIQESQRQHRLMYQYLLEKNEEKLMEVVEQHYNLIYTAIEWVERNQEHAEYPKSPRRKPRQAKEEKETVIGDK